MGWGGGSSEAAERDRAAARAVVRGGVVILPVLRTAETSQNNLSPLPQSTSRGRQDISRRHLQLQR